MRDERHQAPAPTTLTGRIGMAAICLISAGAFAPVQGGVVEECADTSPTQAALSLCLDQRLAEAERDLAAKSKLARQNADATRGREQRIKAQRAFDRSQRRFYSDRDRECGASSGDANPDAERANKIRECMIRMTRERTAQIASLLSGGAAESPQPETKPAAAAPEPPRVQSDPVYGVDWKLTRLIRDNQEVALPPKYRGTLRLETDGRVSGYGAASAFTGRYRLRSAGKIEWAENGFLITHDAQQADPSQVDYLYVDSLERANRAGLSKNGLVLRNEDGSISLSFER